MDKVYDNHTLYGTVYPVPRHDRVTHRIKLEEDTNIALRDKPAWRSVSEDQGGATERFKGRIIKQIPYNTAGVEMINEGIGYNLEWARVRVYSSDLPTPGGITSERDYYEGYVFKSLLVPVSELNSAPIQDPHAYTPELDDDGDPIEETRQQRRRRMRAIQRSRTAQERTGEIPWIEKAVDEPYDEPLYDTVRVSLEVSLEEYAESSRTDLYSNIINRGVQLILLSKNVRLNSKEVARLNSDSFIFGQAADLQVSERPGGPVKALVQLDMKYILPLVESQDAPFAVQTHRLYSTRNFSEVIRCAAKNIRNFQASVDAYCGNVVGFNPSEEADKLEYLIGNIRRVFELNDVTFRESEDDTLEIGWDSAMNIVYMVSSVNGGTRMSDESLSVFDSDDVYNPRIMMYLVYANDICNRVNKEWSFIRFVTKWVYDGLVHVEPENVGANEKCPIEATAEFNETPVMTRSRYSMERLLIDNADFRNEIHDTAMAYVTQAEDLSDLDSLLARLETPDNIFGEFLDRVDIHDIIRRTATCLENLTRKTLEQQIGEKKLAQIEANAAARNELISEYKGAAIERADQINNDLNAATDMGLDFLAELPPADVDLDYQISPDERFNYVDALASRGLPQVPTLSFPDNREVVDLLQDFATSIGDALTEAVMSAVVDMTKTVVDHYLSICNDLDKDATVGGVNINSQIDPDRIEGLQSAVRGAGFEGINISDVLDDISSVLTPSEICLLFIGTPSVKVLDLCLSALKTTKPNFYDRLGSNRGAKRTKLKMFFNFIGDFVGTSEFCASVLESAPTGLGCGGFDSYALRRDLLKERGIMSDADIEQQIEREKQRKRETLKNLKKILRDGITPENAGQFCAAANDIVPQTDPTLSYMVENVTDTVYSGLVNISDKDLENVSNTFLKSDTKKQEFELAPRGSRIDEVDNMRKTQIKIIENLYNVDVEEGASTVDIWVEDKKCFSNLNETLTIITDEAEAKTIGKKGTVKYFVRDDLENGFGIELPVIKAASATTIPSELISVQTPQEYFELATPEAGQKMLDDSIKVLKQSLNKIEDSTGDGHLSIKEVVTLGLDLEQYTEILTKFTSGMLSALPTGARSRPIRKAYISSKLDELDRIKLFNEQREAIESLSSGNRSGLVQLIFSSSTDPVMEFDENTDPDPLGRSFDTLADPECPPEAGLPPSPPPSQSNLIGNNKIVIYEEEKKGTETRYVKKSEYQSKMDISTDLGLFIKNNLLRGYEEYKSSLATDTAHHLSTQQYSLAKMIKKSFSDSGYRLQDDPRSRILEKLGYYSQTLVMNRVSFEISERLREAPLFKTLNLGTSEQASSSTPVKKTKDYIIEYFDFSRKQPPCPDQESVDYLGVRKEQQLIMSEASSLCANSEKGDSGYTDSQISFIKSITRTTIRAHVLDYFFRNIFHFASFSYPEDREILSEFLLDRFEKDLEQIDNNYAINFYSFIDDEMTSEPENYKDVIKQNIDESMNHILDEFDKLYSFKNQSKDLKKELIKVYDVPKYTNPDTLTIDKFDESTYYYHNINRSQTFPLFIEKYVKVSFWTPEDPEWRILDTGLQNTSLHFSDLKTDVIMSESQFRTLLANILEDDFIENPELRRQAPLGANEETTIDDCGESVEFNNNTVPHFKSVSSGYRLCLLLDKHELVLHPSTTIEPRPFIDNYTRIEGVGSTAVNFDTEILDLVQAESPEISRQNKSFLVRFERIFFRDPVFDPEPQIRPNIFRPVPLFNNESSVDKMTVEQFLSTTLEDNIQSFYNSKQYKSIFDFALPIDNVSSLYSIMVMMNSTSNQEIATNFRPTRGSLKGLFELLISNEDKGYDYVDPALAAIGGQEGLRKLAEDLTSTSSYNIKDTIEMNPGLGLEFVQKAIWEATRTILKNQAETRDPNIRLSKSIQDLALQAGAEIPILPISLIGLLPSNIFIPFGWGPPIGGLGFAYHAMGLGYFKGKDSPGSTTTTPAARALEDQLSRSGIEIKTCGPSEEERAAVEAASEEDIRRAFGTGTDE